MNTLIWFPDFRHNVAFILYTLLILLHLILLKCVFTFTFVIIEYESWTDCHKSLEVYVS